MVGASANIYFRGEQLDVAALHRKAEPYLRKASFRILSGKDAHSERGEILVPFLEDVRTNLAPTFMSVRTAMKKWRERARRQRPQLAAEVRNPPLVEAFQEFEEEVRQGRRQPTDFLHELLRKAGAL